ncbi:hypothetical protein [Catenovulum sediminis]|uniref:hypothetical protein n=1 Tax=Catenovulum sediminis TaxID=1740262 RepID=UPI00117E6C3F|nr:hypothetical protein [Catenovulum sediminis]
MNAENFKSEAYRQLFDIFSQVKEKIPVEQAKARTQGFMYAGQFMGLVSQEEANQIIEQAHFDVFSMSVAQRAEIKSRKKQAFETHDESYFDIPTVLRQPSL